eukprot:TRINITY_DN6830_c0_g1_i1.p1 TRINITY_DN6830_c0_g1~~TRINITY_DN6830_c0_g1_i1.p1  ORF type:complete len:495 (-),score=139.57 TRINITY_DN6830_c0_g1_i1:15-1499(-)
MTEKGYANSYYDSERLFAECVKRNMNPETNTVGVVISQSTYTVVWNSFMKWATSQAELGRVITIPQLGAIGQHTQDEKQKFYYVNLAENFKTFYGLTFKMEVEGDVKIGAPTGLPSIKLSNQAIAKDCELDKQTVNLCLTNVFQVIGELLAEGRNIEIDLAPFGKLKGLQRAVTYVPPAKKQAVHGKQTVKALFDMSTEPKVGSKEMAGEEEVKVIGESFGQATAQVEKGFGSVRIAGKGSQAELSASTVFKGIQAAGLSPTRRFKKPEGSGQVLGSLLSAGVDPLAVSHEYSFLAKDTEKLMKTFFKKPPMAQARLPPVLDQFSRTIAAPITSQKHYFSICHKIGSHYTMGSRGLYVDPEIRAVRFKTIEEEGTKLNMMARNFVEPATEEEEYLAATKGDASLKFRVDARKRTYQRYRAYVDQEISSDEVAPINNDWLAKVTQKVPMKMLPVERTNEMLDSMLGEINTDYYTCLLYTSPSPRDQRGSRMPSSA